MVTGEVERLLREYRQNQELVRDIGAHNYQIIYPVQLRHHEKMGISTREAGSPKVRYIFIYLYTHTFNVVNIKSLNSFISHKSLFREKYHLLYTYFKF